MTHVMVKNTTLYDGTIGGVFPHSDILIDDGTIVDTGQHLPLPANTEIFDAQGVPAVPGYIDIHCHGAAGAAFDDGAQVVSTILDQHHKHGTARSVMSFVTDSVDAMEQRIKEASTVVRTNDRVLGIHPEGPFLHPSHKGAHPESLLRDPDLASLQRLIDAAEGTLAQFTLAPERAGGIDAVRTLTSLGIVASVGHSSATFEQANAAFEAGARILTHAFNGMNGIHHRAPGPVIASLRNPDVWLEVINDGIHVHPAVIKSLFLEAPERMILITDAMSATCSPDGHYQLGQLEVTVIDGVARLSEGDSLAGSTLTMDRAVANAVTQVGVSLDVAVAAATTHPAQALGVGKQYGRIDRGYPADILILDPATYLPETIMLSGQQI